MYTKPYWKIIQFLFRQKTPKKANLPRGDFSNHFMTITAFSKFYRSKSTTLKNTVWLKWIAHFAIRILLLHHYKSDLAHLSDLYFLVIGLYKSERWAKSVKKMGTSSEPTKFAQFLVVSVRKYIFKKYLISNRFNFWIVFFCVFL